ncbi:hypothetical protein GMORB2_3099, partial [Geosmithia morbida]
QTQPSVQSVSLIGSWDNFTTFYPMEHDTRRAKGQWKGCHIFRDIICNDDDLSKTRTGGLSMGHTYYYYPLPAQLITDSSSFSPPQYEVDASTETFDPAMPSTTACPSLPGQRVNILTIPYQQSHRQRSASLSSMRITDYKSVDPSTKFMTPQPVNPLEQEMNSRVRPKHSAPGLFRGHTSSRSQSPVPAAWRRLFHSRERGRSRDRHDDPKATPPTSHAGGSDYEESMRGDASSRASSRSMSPESLRRFLSDDMPEPPRCGSSRGEQSTLVIPDDIAEEPEDDSNFATSAVSEVNPYTTGLSAPPRMQRPAPSTSSPSAPGAPHSLSGTAPLTAKNLSSLVQETSSQRSSKSRTSKDHRHAHRQAQAGLYTAEEIAMANVPVLEPAPRTTKSATSSAMASPLSSPTPDVDDEVDGGEPLTFFDDASTVSRKNSDAFLAPDSPALFDPHNPTLLHSACPTPRFTGFAGYSKQQYQHDDDEEGIRARRAAGMRPRPTFGISNDDNNYTQTLPQLLAAREAQFLPAPDATGVDDFADELGWMVDTIAAKAN